MLRGLFSGFRGLLIFRLGLGLGLYFRGRLFDLRRILLFFRRGLSLRSRFFPARFPLRFRGRLRDGLLLYLYFFFFCRRLLLRLRRSGFLRGGSHRLRLYRLGLGGIVVRHRPCLGVLLCQRLLLLELLLGALFFLLTKEKALLLTQCLQYAFDIPPDTSCFLQHHAGLGIEFFSGFRQLNLGHSTLAPPHIAINCLDVYIAKYLIRQWSTKE